MRILDGFFSLIFKFSRFQFLSLNYFIFSITLYYKYNYISSHKLTMKNTSKAFIHLSLINIDYNIY